MNDDKILSLCVSIKTRNGMPLFFRIADANESGTLVPFKIDHNQPIEKYNIDTIYRPQHLMPAEGTLQLIEWESYSQRTETYDTHVRWIEYIRLDSIKDVNQLHIAMINGIDLNLDDDHGYLFEYEKAFSNKYKCAYFKASDFKQKPNGLYALNDRVYKFDVYTIGDSEFAEARTRFIPDLNRKYYLHFNLPNKTQTFLIRDSSEIVKNVIISRIKGCTGGLSRAEKNIVRNFLRDCDTASIIDIIVDRLHCSEDEAQLFFSDFIKKCNQYFVDEDFIQDALLKFVGNNNVFATKYREELRKAWEQDFQTEMQKYSDELSSLDSKNKKAMAEYENTMTEYNNALDLMAKAEERLMSLQNEYDEKLRLASNIDEQIKERITAAKDNLAGFFSEYDIFSFHSTNHSSSSTYSETVSNYVEGQTFSVDCDIIESGELLEYLSSNLTALGADENKASVLGAYLIAAYKLKVSLILAGYKSVEIADAISITLFNKTADRLYVNNEKFVDVQGSGKVVIVYDAFGCMDKVLEATKGRFVCFVAQTSEEMSIEPRSIYNYALPVFPEYFITSDNEDGEILGCVVQGEILSESKIENVKTMLPRFCLPKLAFTRLQRLLGAAQELYGRYNLNDVFTLQVMPVMLSLSMREELIELIMQKFTSTEKVLRLIGVKQ